MDTRQFKLNLSSLFSQRAGKDAPAKDENQPPTTDRRNPVASRLFTPVPARNISASKAPRPQSANSRNARLLQLDSHVEDNPSYEDERPLQPIDNQALYGRDCRRERKISNLEEIQDRKPADEFKKLSSAIQREIKMMQEEQGQDHLLTARTTYRPEASGRGFTLKTTPRKDAVRAEATFAANFIDSKAANETQLLERIGQLEREMREKDEEIASLQKQVQARTVSIRTLEKELSLRCPDSEAKSVLAQICDMLNVISPQNVLPALRKLEAAGKNAARMERLMAEISTVVCPDRLETSGEAVVLAVRRWESELLSHRGLRSEDSDFTEHFRQVFDVKDSENLREAANRIFLQTHELKTFSKHLKQVLALSEDCALSSVLLFVRQLLRRVPT